MRFLPGGLEFDVQQPSRLALSANHQESVIDGRVNIDKLHEPKGRLAAWRRLITDTVESVTVAPAMAADGRPTHLWDPRRIDIRFMDKQP